MRFKLQIYKNLLLIQFLDSLKKTKFFYMRNLRFLQQKKIYFIKCYKTRNRIIFICMSIIQIIIKIDIIDFKKI